MTSSSQPLPLGALDPWSTQGEYNSHLFVINQAISKIQTATLVRIEACSNDGGLSPIGQVDVLPLVGQVDGFGRITPHVTLYGLPYLRVAAGSSGIILDPQVGDIGVAVFASRDISSIKATHKPGGPGSGSRYDYSDGIYLSTVLSASAPTQYIQFNEDGITAVSPQAVTVTAPSIVMGASGSTPQTLMTDAFFTWFTTDILPMLQAVGYRGPAPPTNSVTTSVKGS
jgi:hypothetical protein